MARLTIPWTTRLFWRTEQVATVRSTLTGKLSLAVSLSPRIRNASIRRAGEFLACSCALLWRMLKR